MGKLGFRLRGMGGLIDPPKTGGGVQEKGSIDRTIQQLFMNSGAKGAEIFESISNGQFLFTKYMANDDISEPPRCAASKNLIFFFCRVLGLGDLWGPGVSFGRILEGPSKPFFGGL